jgi:CheY-like chemotaxis protein
MTTEGERLSSSRKNRTAADLNQILKTVLQLRENQPHAGNLIFNIGLEENLPKVCVDRRQMEQVLSTLIVNAEEAIEPDGGGQIDVKISVERGRVHVTVMDNGRGIHWRDMAGLFDDQGRDPRLYVCAEIVKDHGGELYAWSSYRKGSVFTLELPIDESEPQQIPARQVSGQEDLRGKCVLVIDDEVHITTLISEVLESHGAAIDLANSGLEAIEQVKSKQYDLLICDQRMPDMTGERLYRWIGFTRPELQHRFLFVTGDLLDQQVNDFFNETGVQHLTKPFRTAELVEAVGHVLNRSQQSSF